MSHESESASEGERGETVEERAPVLRIGPRRLDRRIPGHGLVRFRAPAAAAEERLAPFYEESNDARAFANELIAISIEEPQFSAADVDGWSERARAIGRVAAAQTLNCFAAYRRLAGGGLDGDARLREAMRLRNEELRKQLRATIAVLGASANVSRILEPSRLLAQSAVAQVMQQQRQLDRLVKPSYLTEITRMSKRFELMRPTYIDQMTRLNSPALRALAQLGTIGKLPRSPLFDQMALLKKLTESFAPPRGLVRLGASVGFDLPRSPLFGQMEQLKKVMASVAAPRAVFGGSGDIAGLGWLSRLARPSYFGALYGVGRTSPDYTKLFPRLGEGVAAQFDAINRLLSDMGGRVTGPFRAYVAWLEREWAAAKAEHRPPPVLFVIASLPALLGLRLLAELEADDEPLLARLEGALAGDTLAAELQTAVQRVGLLDAVAKRHLAQALDWISVGRYVDAAPPLYQGLERAFRLTARERGVVDSRGTFLVAAHRGRMRKIEDALRYLGLDPLYLRFLHAWVFGDFGNLARHGDLAEDEHRLWVLRAVLALVGWLEYVGGEQDAVADLVTRLELDQGAKPDVA